MTSILRCEFKLAIYSNKHLFFALLRPLAKATRIRKFDSALKFTMTLSSLLVLERVIKIAYRAYSTNLSFRISYPVCQNRNPNYIDSLYIGRLFRVTFTCYGSHPSVCYMLGNRLMNSCLHKISARSLLKY